MSSVTDCAAAGKTAGLLMVDIVKIRVLLQPNVQISSADQVRVNAAQSLSLFYVLLCICRGLQKGRTVLAVGAKYSVATRLQAKRKAGAE